MSTQRLADGPRRLSHDDVTRRGLLAAGSVAAVGALAGCLDRIGSSQTNTEAAPAAAFAGERQEQFSVGEPHVSRLTSRLSGGSGLLSGEIELEGWVTSSAVMAQNHNSSRSNSHNLRGRDGDSDGDGVGDGSEEDDELVAYLGGNPIVAERFTVCLPDAAVPGGNGSIREEVTPERLIAYLTAGDGADLLSTADSKESRAVAGGGDCDDDDPGSHPGALCGTTPHFVAEVSGPTATGGSLAVVRSTDGTVTVLNTPPTAEDASAKVCVALDDDPCGPGVWARTGESGSSTSVSVSQVMVQPPRCPRPFPALLYVQRCESNDQLVYTGGWIVDDAALYEDSMTVLSMAGPTHVVGIECCFDYDSDREGFGDLMKRSVSGERARRGARLDSGTVEELVETGVLSESGGNDILVRKRPGKRTDDIELTHVSLDAPVFHLVSASRASRDVKFKAGAELSKAVN